MKKISFLLIVVFFIAACGGSVNTDQTSTDASDDVKIEKADAQIAILDVKGMHCESCVNTITTLLTDLDGVDGAKVSLEYEQAKVKFDPSIVSTDDIKDAIVNKGYEVGEIEVMALEEKAKKTEE